MPEHENEYENEYEDEYEDEEQAPIFFKPCRPGVVTRISR
jgi:hypothetical protein